MRVESSITQSEGFLCVLTRDVKEIFEQPANLNFIYYMNTSYGIINETASFEPRFTMSLLNVTESNLEHSSSV
jgi:hypothetical protein